MPEPDEHGPAAGKPGNAGVLDTADKLLKGLALFALLVTGLGYPAVIMQFTRRGIPIAFIDKELAIRAGLMPTLFLVVILLLLFFCSRLIRAHSKMQAWMRTYFAKVCAGIMIFAYAVTLLDAATRYDLAHAREIREPAISVHFTGIVLLVFLLTILILGLIAAPGIAFVAWTESLGSPESTHHGGDPSRDDQERSHAEKAGAIARLTWSIYSTPWQWLQRMQPLRLTITSWLLLAAACTLSAWLQFYIKGPLPLARLVQDQPHYYLYFLAVASLVPSVFAVYAQADIQVGLAGSDARHRRWQLLTASVCCAYIPLVVIHSAVLWPRMPAWFGGGKTSAITLWVKADDLPDSVASNLRMLRIATEDKNITKSESSIAKRELSGSVITAGSESVRLDNCFLIDANSDVVIVSDSDDPYAATLVLPRDAVRAFGSRR